MSVMSKHPDDDKAKVSGKSQVSTKQLPKRGSWKFWPTTAKEKRKFGIAMYIY